MPAYQPDMRRAYATAALTGVAPFQGAAEETARRADAAPARQPGESLEQLFARGVPIRTTGPVPPPTPAPPPTPLSRGLPPISADEAQKTLAMMNAPRPAAPTFGAGDFGAILQGTDPVIGAGINIRDTPEVQLAKMQLHAQTAAGESAAANAAQQNALHAQGLQQQQLSNFGRQQLGEQNLALSRQQFGLDQQKLAQMATEFNERQKLERDKIASNENIEKGKYAQPAMQAAANAALFRAIADNIGKPGGPVDVADAKRQMAAVMAGAGRGAAAPGPASPLAAVAGPAGASVAPTAGPAADDPVERLLAQVRPVMQVPKGAALSGDKITKTLDAIAAANLNPAQRAAAMQQIGGLSANPAEFGDLLVKSAANALSAAGPAAAGSHAPGQPGQVYYPQELGLPFQLQSNLNARGRFWRGLTADPFTGSDDPNNFLLYNEAQTNNGHIVPIDRADVLGPYARRNLTPAEQETHRRRLSAAADLLREMMKSGSYR